MLSVSLNKTFLSLSRFEKKFTVPRCEGLIKDRLHYRWELHHWTTAVSPFITSCVHYDVANQMMKMMPVGDVRSINNQYVSASTRSQLFSVHSIQFNLVFIVCIQSKLL